MFKKRPSASSARGFSGAKTKRPFNGQRSNSSYSRSDRGDTSRKDASVPSYGNRSHSSGGHSAGPRRFSNAPQRSGNTFSRSGSFSHRPQPSRGRGGGRVMKTFDVSRFINKNPVTTTEEEVFVPKHSFSDFGIDKKLAFTITNSGITSPSPIQDEIIPYILQGKDVIGLANTGTGKTAAFLVPLIDMTLRAYGRQTLILTPTRELALQIEAELRKLSVGFKLYSTTCVGGTNIRPQIQGLRRKNHFIIGTPGRVIDLMERGALNARQITTVVLDEADRMLDMGFIHDMKRILVDVPKERETLFFSATMSDDIKRLVHEFLRDPITVSVKKKDITGSIEQDVVPYAHVHKFETLTKLLEDPSFKRVLIFGAMKHSVEKLAIQIATHGISTESIHGNKSHPQRQRSLKRFKDGHARVLVATDVAARGIHVDNVTHVINYDLPATYEDYVHRIGRTGRGKESGKALTFIEQ
jgi:ATP-dependent RNA helicase RhlE